MPPPISPIKSLLSETWASRSYRLQEYSDGLLLPALFTASTHTLSPGSRDPTIPLRETWLKSRAGLSLLSTTTLYLDTTDDGAHQWTSMLPMCSPSVMVKNSFRRGACGSWLAPLTPGQRHPVLEEIWAQGSWFSRQELYSQNSWDLLRTVVLAGNTTSGGELWSS